VYFEDRIPPRSQFRASVFPPQNIIRELTYRRKDNIESAVTDISDISVRRVLTTLAVYRTDTRCGSKIPRVICIAEQLVADEARGREMEE